MLTEKTATNEHVTDAELQEIIPDLSLEAITKIRYLAEEKGPQFFKLLKDAAINTPHQSKGPNVRYPGVTRAAAELGVTRAHLFRVLNGERQSPTLMSRWKTWLKHNPEFARLQSKVTA